MIGTLLKIPTEYYLLEATQNKWSWINAKESSYLLCIEEMDFTKEWAMHVAGTAGLPAPRAAWAGASAQAAWAAWAAGASTVEYSKIYQQSKKEFVETGKIKGYKFLYPDGIKYVWLSCCDINYIMEFNKS